jgi:hypothetical protein
VRLDNVELYHAVFQVVGSSTVLQNDQAVTLNAGDVALMDSTRPVTYVNEAYAQWLSLQLPRQSLISHLGLEPRGGSRGRRGARAGHLLFQVPQVVTTLRVEFVPKRASDARVSESARRQASSHRSLRA